jgi:hypothetical protein
MARMNPRKMAKMRRTKKRKVSQSPKKRKEDQEGKEETR